MKKFKIYLGIYDDYKMQRQFLHHTLEREKYEVNYSAGKPELLDEYFAHHTVNILIVHARSVTPRLQLSLRNYLIEAGGNLKIIFYACTDKSELKLTAAFKKYERELFYTEDDVQAFYRCLDKVIGIFYPKEMKNVLRQKILLPPEHPFYKIVNSRLMLDILRLLSEGKNFREISVSTQLSEHTVRTYIRRMRVDTDSINIPQLVSTAKEFHLI